MNKEELQELMAEVLRLREELNDRSTEAEARVADAQAAAAAAVRVAQEARQAYDQAAIDYQHRHTQLVAELYALDEGIKEEDTHDDR
jgi:hypothetical protein